MSCFFIIILIKLKNTFTMGRGDIKTKKGKIFAGSFGKSRPAKTVKNVTANAAIATAKKAATKKAK